MQFDKLEIPMFKDLEEAMVHFKSLHTIGYSAEKAAKALVLSEIHYGKPVLDIKTYIPAANIIYTYIFQELWKFFDYSAAPLDASNMAEEYNRLRQTISDMRKEVEGKDL